MPAYPARPSCGLTRNSNAAPSPTAAVARLDGAASARSSVTTRSSNPAASAAASAPSQSRKVIASSPRLSGIAQHTPSPSRHAITDAPARRNAAAVIANAASTNEID